MLPSEVQARTFELLGAVPLRLRPDRGDRRHQGRHHRLAGVPVPPTVTYHVHKFHNFHTVTNHFYISRPIFLHRTAFDAWPQHPPEYVMRDAVAASVAFQRELPIEEDTEGRRGAHRSGLRDHRADRRRAREVQASSRAALGRCAKTVAGSCLS